MSEPRSKVFYASAEDPQMQRAMHRARTTFKYFWRELSWEHRRIIPALELAAVKAAFGEEPGSPDDVEHMWLGEVTFDGDTIEATLLNEPNRVRSVREGDRVTLALDQLEDWMYVVRGRVHGGFTVQAIRARMSPAERREHDRAWGFDFGDAEHVALVPDWSPPPKPGLMSRLFGGAPAPAAEPDPTAEHPMSENMGSSFAEAIDRDPRAFLEETGPDGLTTLHSLALAGSAAGVQVLLAKGADPTRRTPHGKTARELAEHMGWPRVVALLRAAEARGSA